MFNKNRGMFLESLINKTNQFYEKNDLALFHKKPVEINFSGIKRNQGGKPEITKGWIKGKSTTDYYGIYQGVFIAFEAKSTSTNSLPLSSIKEHQLNYIKKINALGGLGFLIIYYGEANEYFLLMHESFKNLKQKSVSVEFARRYGYKLELIYPGIIDFIPILDKLL